MRLQGAEVPKVKDFKYLRSTGVCVKVMKMKKSFEGDL